MKILCPACGGDTKRNGKTSSGATRWRCKACGASTTQRYDNEPKLLELFLRWLLSKKTQGEFGMPGRTFRHLTNKFWDLWPVAPVCDEVPRGESGWRRAGRDVVIAVACTEKHVIGWHLARSENAQAWAALMARIAPPDVVITDGGKGFEKARRAVWPNTRVQRRVFHAFCQVKRQTTTRPRLQAGVGLYGIARAHACAGSLNEAAEWLAGFSNWCTAWEGFLKEKEVVDGRIRYKHERLRTARGGLLKLCRVGTLFTYLDEGLLEGGPVPATTNRIEGGVNAQIRHMLREHRGLRLTRRVKAAFWWCYMDLEARASPKEILKEMPTDVLIAEFYRAAAEASEKDERWGAGGTAVQWNDLHASGAYRMDTIELWTLLAYNPHPASLTL